MIIMLIILIVLMLLITARKIYIRGEISGIKQCQEIIRRKNDSTNQPAN